MSRLSLSAFVTVLLLAYNSGSVLAQPGPPPSPPTSVEARGATMAILDEIDKKSELMANLEYLCDIIGPRLTGSPNLKRANDWTRDRFKDYGLENAHLESWKIAHGWTRGPAVGHVVAPTEQRLLVESAGWSPSTKGPVRGPVVHLKAEKPADFDAYKGKVKGAWIITGAVSVQPTPRNPEPNSGIGGDRPRDFAAFQALRKAMKEFLIAEGAAGMLRDSNKEHGLINMTGEPMTSRSRRCPKRSSPPSPTGCFGGF